MQQQEQQQQGVNALRTVPEMQLLLKMGLIDEKDVLYKGPPLEGPLPSMWQLHCGDVALLKPSTDDLLRRIEGKGQGMLFLGTGVDKDHQNSQCRRSPG